MCSWIPSANKEYWENLLLWSRSSSLWLRLSLKVCITERVEAMKREWNPHFDEINNKSAIYLWLISLHGNFISQAENFSRSTNIYTHTQIYIPTTFIFWRDVLNQVHCVLRHFGPMICFPFWTCNTPGTWKYLIYTTKKKNLLGFLILD